MVSEADWAAERQRFIDTDDAPAQGTNGPPEDSAGHYDCVSSHESLLGEQFAKLAEQLFAADTVHAVLERIVTASVQVLRDAQLASITLREGNGRFSTPVQTHPVATALDELQYTHDEGPCVQATRQNGTGLVTSPELGQDPQWPSWGPAAAERGVRSVLSVGLFPHRDPPRLGAVNCYSPEPHGLSNADGNVALLLGAHAATAVAAQQAIAAAELEASQLRHGLHSRDVIGQAKGILMHRRGISAGEAFDILRKASQDLHIKLLDIARTLTTRPDQLLDRPHDRREATGSQR